MYSLNHVSATERAAFAKEKTSNRLTFLFYGASGCGTAMLGADMHRHLFFMTLSRRHETSRRRVDVHQPADTRARIVVMKFATVIKYTQSRRGVGDHLVVLCG